jgi:hypothetical protein
LGYDFAVNTVGWRVFEVQRAHVLQLATRAHFTDLKIAPAATGRCPTPLIVSPCREPRL